MFQIVKRNPLAAVLAVLMHVVIIAFMVVGVDWLEKPKPIKSTVEVVQAKVIDQAKVDAEVAKLKEAEKKKVSEAEAKRRKEEQRLAELKKKQEQEKKRLADLEKKRKTEEQKRKTDAKKKAEAEKKRKAAAKKKAEAEKKRKAELEKKRKAEAKKKAAAEKKRKAELEKKRKAEAERKRKAEAEKKRQAAEQKAREDALAAQLEGERLASERDRYLVLIRDKIERNWLRPTTVNQCLKALMRVRLIPGGGVAAVNITRGSGNGAFDRSAEQAIYKADPLPVPTGAGFEAFRDFNIEFKPDCN